MSDTRLLWFNWKDVRNPDAGGAEVFTHEVARRLVRNGFTVTLFCSSFDDAPPFEIVDGVTVIRRGSRRGVYREARRFYRARQDSFDIIVDEVNTRPFMTPCFAHQRIVALIHQLAREYWFFETSFPVSLLGYYLLEDMWLKEYRDVPVVTVSNSTKADLLKRGFKDIRVVPEGLSYQPLDSMPQKEKEPTIIYLGRLNRAKRPDHLLEALRIVLDRFPSTRLWIVGDGYAKKRLEANAPRRVEFLGWQPKSRVSELLSRSWLLVYPSVREGYGLSILEASAHGTPAVGYDVPGVRDAILDGRTGFLAKNGDKRDLAGKIISILDDPTLREKLSRNSLGYSRGFNWQKTAEAFAQSLV